MLRVHVHVMPSGSLVVVLGGDTGVAPISIENRCADPSLVIQACHIHRAQPYYVQDADS
jgi:hypothetical protein